MEMTQRFQIKTDEAVNALHNMEALLVSAAVSVAPLGALLPAAWMSLDHMERMLSVPSYVAYPIAIALEALGYAAVTVAVEMLQRRNWLLLSISCTAFGLYLVDILALNVSLSIAEILLPSWLPSARVLAGACLALMSIPAALLVAVRAMLRGMTAREALAVDQHALDLAAQYAHEERLEAMRLADEEKKRAERRQERAAKAPEVSKKVSTPAETYPKDIRNLTHDQKATLSKLTDKEIVEKVHVSLKSAQNWLKAFRAEGL